MYKLLKPLPGFEVGTEFEKIYSEDLPRHASKETGEYYAPKGLFAPAFHERYMTSDFFGPVATWPKRFEDLPDYLGHAFNLEGGTFLYTKGYPTTAHAKSANAFRKLSALQKHINGDWVADWENGNQAKHFIYRQNNELDWAHGYSDFHHITFKTREAAEFSLKHHRELWEEYLMISK